MISRYTNDLQITTTQDGVRYYKTALPSFIPQDVFQYTITAKDGDRFDSLAAHYYKDASKWWIIAKANNLAKGTIFIKGGTEIIIPTAGL